jgi:hypothetical protein
LTTFRNIPSLREVIEDQKFDAQHQEEELESFFDHPCQFAEKTKESW